MTKFLKNHKQLDFVKDMPPLKNKLEGEPYSDEKSEVLNWLADHPMEMAIFIFEIISGKDKRREQLIFYDKKTGTWTGSNNREQKHDS